MSVISISTSAPLSVLYLRCSKSRFPSFFESTRSSLVSLLTALGLEVPVQWGGSATYPEHVAVIDHSSFGRKTMMLQSIKTVNDISGHCMSTSCQHYMSIDVGDDEGECESVRIRMKASEIVKVLRWLGHPIPSHFGGIGPDKYHLDSCRTIQRAFVSSSMHESMSDDQKKLLLANLHEVHDFYIDPTCRGGACNHYCQVMNDGLWSAWMSLSASEIRRVFDMLGKKLPEHFRERARRSLIKTSSPASRTLRERRSMGALHIDTQPY